MQSPLDDLFSLLPATENKLHVEKTNHTISSTENEDVTMNCIAQSSNQQASLLSVVWFYKSKHSGGKPLVKVHPKGMVEIVEENMAGRLQFLRPSSGDFSLVMRNVELGDSGVYYCQVQEWQYKNSNGAWVQQALELSGYTSMTALPPGNACIAPHPGLLSMILLISSTYLPHLLGVLV